MKIFLILSILLAAGCQDHHFIPYEEAGDIKLQTQNITTHQRTFSDTTGKAQKEVMSEAYRGDIRPEEGGGLIASGRLLLGEEQKSRDFKDFSIYVIAWEAEKKGPPLAVVRYKVTGFPFRFALDGTNLMASQLPEGSTKLVIEARLDADGDPISKEQGDVFGFSSEPITVGTTDAEITLNENR